MIEAVNSVLANSTVFRGNVAQSEVGRSLASNPERVQEAASVTVPQAPFISPFIAIDVDYNAAVLQIRDSETGDVVRQFPSESRLQERQQAQAEAQNRSLQSQGEQTIRSDAAAPDAPEVSQSDTQSFRLGLQAQQGTSAPDVAQAQIASAAFSVGAQTGSVNQSAGVSVLA